MLLGQQLQLRGHRKIEAKPVRIAHALHNSNTQLSIIRKEMPLFECGRLRGKNLQAVYSYLLTIEKLAADKLTRRSNESDLEGDATWKIKRWRRGEIIGSSSGGVTVCLRLPQLNSK
jgi:hypothetical protein